MAITFVDSAYDNAADITTTITLPTTAAGDVIFLEIAQRSLTNPTFGGTFSPTFSGEHTQPWNSSNWEAYLYHAVCTGDHSGETIVITMGTGSGAIAHVVIYRGVDTSDPVEALVGEENASGDETQAQITTLTDGAWVALMIATGNLNPSSQACTSPGALTERQQSVNFNSDNNMRVDHASAEKTTAGATGAFTWAQTNGVGASIAYAIAPAAVAVFPLHRRRRRRG